MMKSYKGLNLHHANFTKVYKFHFVNPRKTNASVQNSVAQENSFESSNHRISVDIAFPTSTAFIINDLLLLNSQKSGYYARQEEPTVLTCRLLLRIRGMYAVSTRQNLSSFSETFCGSKLSAW